MAHESVRTGALALRAGAIDGFSGGPGRLARLDLLGSLLSGRWLWTAPVVAGLLVLSIYPTIFLVALALSNSRLGRPFQSFAGLNNLLKAILDPAFQAALTRSIAFAIASTAVELVLGVAVAVLMTRLVKAGRILMSLILLPLMTPPVMVAVAWKLILAPVGGLANGTLQKLGLIGEPLSFFGSAAGAWSSVGLADAWQWTPFVAILAYAALLAYPKEIDEAAMLDGAGPWARFRLLMLPFLAPSLVSIALLKLVIGFKLFDLVFVLTYGGPGFETTTAAFHIWRLALEQFDAGRAAAETLIFALVVGLVTWPLTRWQHRLEAREA